MTVSLRCPVCRADNTQPPACRRCKADLSLLWAVEAERERRLAEAHRHASAGRWQDFLDSVLLAHSLRTDDQTRRLLAAGYLLTGDRVRALQQAFPFREQPA